MTEEPSLLRPYLMTSGRAQPVDQSLEIEAQVMTSRLGAASHPKLTFERQEIVSLCRNTMSVAEVAAMLGLHIGVDNRRDGEGGLRLAHPRKAAVVF